ncbi:MAG: SMC-Scp complex subunit ScpB [Cellvibrionales bacterium TMED49]|nr:SMC-Scp complex subunit ScpB [Porticoccaceae bacterium]OUU39604.1 MAG: SMC-Scp complex subunit ScpB [Cellvibrionales bacterium TMED49]
MKSMLLRQIIEGALLLSPTPLAIKDLEQLFSDSERPQRDQILVTIEDIQLDCRDRGYELVEVASGFRFQIREQLAGWMHRLWKEKPKRYSKAMLETLALIAYRQPLTRGDIELVRGVAVSSDMIRTLQEREWIKIVGHRNVPGKPALYATTKQFLNYFNLSDLGQLPKLTVITNIEADGDHSSLGVLESGNIEMIES